MNIYCFPYAGGSSFIYSELRKKASDKYRIVPMEYPGHGLRMGEVLSDSIEYIVDDMFRQIQKKMMDHPLRSSDTAWVQNLYTCFTASTRSIQCSVV